MSLLRQVSWYPLILLSTATSLAINLASVRTQYQTEKRQYEAQVSVLSQLVERLYNGKEKLDRTAVDRELELVGLLRQEGPGGQLRSVIAVPQTTWREVFYRRTALEKPEESIDWERLVKEADEASAPVPRPSTRPAAAPTIPATTPAAAPRPPAAPATPSSQSKTGYL